MSETTTTLRTVDIIRDLVERVHENEHAFGVLSTGEKLAVALVLDRHDLIAQINGGYEMLEAMDRLGPTWLRAALIVQRDLPVNWYRRAP